MEEKYDELDGWNYRIQRRFWRNDVTEEDIEHFVLVEVYYNKDGSVAFWTEEPVAIGGDTVGDMKEGFHLMMKAFDRPVLDEKGNEIVE